MSIKQAVTRLQWRNRYNSPVPVTDFPNRLDKEIQKELTRMVKEIREEAEGRLCGDCRHFHGSWCGLHNGVDGNPIEVRSGQAVACRDHEV